MASVSLLTASVVSCGGVDKDSLIPERAADSGSAGSTGGSDGSNGGADAGGSGSNRPPPIPCDSTADCPADVPTCNLGTDTCVSCFFDTDCGGDEGCIAGHCESVSPCASSADCSGVTDKAVCNQGYCTECARESCGAGADCIGGQCVPVDVCLNSLDCPSGKVCDVANGRCELCIGDSDCEPEQVCSNNECHAGCDSDLECVGDGLLCHSGTYCAECVVDLDCPSPHMCSDGSCVPQICRPGQTSCAYAGAGSDSILICSDDGRDLQVDSLCAQQTTCAVSRSVPSCQPWVCSPGDVFCNSNATRRCKADGLGSDVIEECAGTDSCLQDQFNSTAGPPTCGTMICTPGAPVCSDNAAKLLQCDVYGASTNTVIEDCDSFGFYCKLDHCVEYTCQNGVGCNGTQLATCSASGTELLGDLNDCATESKVCHDGVCKTDAIDVILSNPATEGISSYPHYEGLYRADVDRVITELGMRFSTIAPVTLMVFRAYEVTAGESAYYYEHTELVTVGVAQPVTGEGGFYSSGLIHVPLKAGKEYLIVTEVTTATAGFYADIYYRDQGNIAVSFGEMIGGNTDPQPTLAVVRASARRPVQRIATTAVN